MCTSVLFSNRAYQQAGVRPSYGRLDPSHGATFRRTLERAVASGSPVVQVVTWNDFGEGTGVEPAREYGYRYLEAIQGAMRRFPGAAFPFRPEDLRLPLRIYHLRKRMAQSSSERKALDEVVDLLFAGEVARASQGLDTLEGSARQPSSRAR